MSKGCFWGKYKAMIRCFCCQRTLECSTSDSKVRKSFRILRAINLCTHQFKYRTLLFFQSAQGVFLFLFGQSLCACCLFENSNQKGSGLILCLFVPLRTPQTARPTPPRDWTALYSHSSPRPFRRDTSVCRDIAMTRMTPIHS